MTYVPTIADPVEAADGTFQVSTVDLALGGTEPRGLSLSRYYNSALRRQNPAAMSCGWVHNYYCTAKPVSSPLSGLGAATVQQMAPMIVASWAALNFYTPQGDARNWTITALIAKWGADQLLTNSVSVTLGKDMLQFTRQPDGLFTPPAGSTMTLTNTGNSYSLKERRGRTFKFNSAGFLTNIADPYAAQMTFTYDSSNRVQTVKDSVNRSLTFVYTNTYTNGALVQVADSANRSVSYRYTTNSAGQLDLAAVIDPEGQPTTFLYDATNHQITAVLDALSQTVSSNIYDGFGRVTTQYSQGDTTKAWTLGWSDSARFEQDPTGSLRWFLFDEKSRLVAVQDALGNVSQTVYDGQDHVIMTISPSNATSRFIYDANQNLVCTVDPLGHSNQFFYDSTNNLIRSVDARGNTNTFGYNTNFSLVAMTSGAGDWVTYNYNTNGTLHSRTDAGSTNTYDYDSYCQVSRITYSGTLGSELFLNSPLGDVLTHTNARSLPPTSFTYNKRRQLTATIGPTNVTTGIAYDAVGNVQFTTNSRGYVTTNTWSSTRKLLSTGFPATPQGSPITTNGYDSRDWLQLTVSNPSKPIAATVNYTYDPAGRIALLSDPLQRQTHFGYDQDGRQTGVTNDAGEKVTQQWDARGLLTQVTDNASHNVQRGYDEAGNQTSLTNRNAKTWQFQFDGADRLITTKSAKTTNSLAYNSRGLVQYLTNSMRQTTTLGYDGKGRLTSRTDPVGTINYGHDANDNLTGATNAGQSVGLYWTFDAYDRVASYKDLDGNVIQYGYDAAGNLTTLVYPGNRSVSYTYDSLNRLTTVTDWATRQTTFTYDLANRLTSITRPNGKVRLINYDAAGQTTNIIEKLANNYPIAFFQLNWTNAGRVQSEFAAPLPHTNAPPPPYRGMAIGDDNRITTVTNGNSTLSVTYDANGNLTNGPITNLAQATYSYNARNQLLSAGGLQYGYDPAGNRTSLTNGANVTRFVVNPNAPLPQVLMRITSTGTNYYIYGLGLLYEVTVNNAGVETATNTYHFDYRGSTVAITDAGGNVRDRMEYSAYGMLTYRAGTNDTPFLFNGRYGVQTDLNGLYYMRARYYNPYLCRFLNPDPAGFEGGMNFYAFANGNPVSYFDPSGLGAVGGNAAFSWINNASGGSTSSSDPFGLGGNSDNSPLLNPNANQSGQPCIMCHGVSAAGFNGNINAFSGLATISGVTPQAAATMQKWANSLQENGPQLLADIGTGAVFFAGGLASVRSAAPAVADTTLASTVNLAEGEASLVLTRNGQLIAQQPVGSMLTHADFAAQNGAVTASGSLAPGYWVGTVGKVNGSIIGMNSMTFYGNQMPNANATAALRATFR
ncbi:MAG: hypothetical protein NTW03_03035 [Verrucomicrobia bacterium]|nr:hypothetical protein [Verrucomicrobiota bacterium]